MMRSLNGTKAIYTLSAFPGSPVLAALHQLAELPSLSQKLPDLFSVELLKSKRCQEAPTFPGLSETHRFVTG